MSRFIYTAKLVPIGVPVTIPDAEPGQAPVTEFHDKSFSIERTANTKPEIWMDHDRDLRIGNVVALFTDREWWCCDFMLSRDVPDDIEFDVGHPVSVGLSYLKIGSLEPYLREVSIVPRGAIEGAEITSRYQIKETPPAPATKRTEPVGQVIYGGPLDLVRRNIGKVLAIR